MSEATTRRCVKDEERASLERMLRRLYWVAGPSAAVLGGLLVVDPVAFYAALGLPYVDPLAQTLYGAVLVGVGVSSFRALAEPLASRSLLFFIAAYKTVAVLALAPRLLTLPSAPLAAWAVCVLWALSGLVAAWALERPSAFWHA